MTIIALKNRAALRAAIYSLRIVSFPVVLYTVVQFGGLPVQVWTQECGLRSDRVDFAH